jgi:GTP-binding protein
MAFVDELKIKLALGAGATVLCAGLHEKGKEYSGPAGGNGGDGGDVYIRGVRDMNLLSRYRGEKKFEARKRQRRREPGQSRRRGKDMVIDLPVGSVIRNTQTGEITSS